MFFGWQKLVAYTTAIKTTEDSLERIGGKGRSLAKMACAGFAVPGGFLVTTDAYRFFVADNNLQAQILDLAKPELRDGYPVFESSSEAITGLILSTSMASAIAEDIRAAYAELGREDLPVAVRSSANAEDLPGFSFAGQQETFLNVRGADALVNAVQK